MRLRLVKVEDTKAILDIYAQYIDTAISFEYVLPDEESFRKRIKGIAKEYPYLVCETDEGIAGYAYAHRQMEREAYQWNAELSIYLSKDATSKGYGKKLYTSLMDILKLQGVKTVYGLVTVPNEKSEALHESLGFEKVGVCKNTGYKSGAWRDVTWFEKQIAPYESEPKPIFSVWEIPQEKIAEILRKNS